MKYLKYIKQIIALTTVGFLFNACEKVDSPEPLGDGGQRIVKFVNYGGLGDNFANSNMAFPSSDKDSVELNMQYSTPSLSGTDMTVTIAYDAAALAAYNATVPVNKQYQKLPDSTYSLPKTTLVIKAGQTISESIYLYVYPNKIDGSINYMLPLKIVTVTGGPSDVKAASGTGTAYFHFIGNPIAGLYNVVGTRYNYTGGIAWAGPPAPIPVPVGTVNLNGEKVASAIDGLNVAIDFANLGALDFSYIVAGKDATFAEISYGHNATFTGGNSNIKKYIVSYTPPSPGVKAKFHIITHYNNNSTGTGNDRIVDEEFTHQ